MLSLLPACAGINRGELPLSGDMQRGRFAEARRELLPRVQDTSSAARESRDFLLDRMRLGMVTLADGQPELAEPVMFETFLQLRRQGVNDDATVAAGIFGERGIIFWKGEPFEQAMAYSSIAQTYAMLGQWDNARAAALSSLFLLKNFGDAQQGGRKSTEDIAREAARREQQRRNAFEEYLDRGYSAVQTNFALGYLLAGVSNWALGSGDRDRQNEAREHFASAVQLDRDLTRVVDEITSGRANTVLLVEYGPGPQKTYRDGNPALAIFRPRMRSSGEELSVTVGGGPTLRVPEACDINRMAQDHMWNNFEDIRVFKQALGTILIAGGVARASSREKIDAADIAVIALGILARESARVDLRHCDVLPQRVYVAAVNVAGPGSSAEVAVPSDPASRLVLTDLSPPPGGVPIQFRTVRLLSGGMGNAPWQSTGRLYYANDRAPERVPGDDLPYILGGTCLRVPTHETLSYYQSQGNLRDLTLAALQNLYREEGIGWDANDPKIQNSVHVLDGGRSLIPPLEGTSGYARLFGQPRGPYRPKSAAVREYVQRLRAEGRLAGAGLTDPNSNTR